MSGRYTLRRLDLVRAALDATPYLPAFEEFDQRRIVPRFNIAPSQHVAIVRISGEGKRVLDLAEWGLIPSWTKEKPRTRPINARAETVATSGMFRHAFAHRRCLIPADGFYEWHGSKPPRQPYFIHRKDDGIFAFAGLWERWKPQPDAEPIETCTIITTTANELMKPIHDRMPVIIEPADYGRWLDPKVPASEIGDLLKPSSPDDLQATAISSRVNNVKNDGAELLEPDKSFGA